MPSPYLNRPMRTIAQALADREAANEPSRPAWPMSRGLALWIAVSLAAWTAIILAVLAALS
jgi:hypothetical protein